MKPPRLPMLIPLLFVVLWAVITAVAPLPVAYATPLMSNGLKAADWAQLENLLPPPTPPTWEEQAKLRAAVSVLDDRFGHAVAISGDTVLIGAYGVDDNGSVSGAAYVFVRNGTVWNQQAKLTASDGAAVDVFGSAVALVGDMAIIGAPQDDDTADNGGSAYVFTRTGTTWSEQGKLTASDATPGAQFGSAIAMAGDTLVIGAPGGNTSGFAYVFTRTGNTWNQQGKLIPSDGMNSDEFGSAVAVAGDTAVVGARGSDVGGTGRGAAYVFTRTGTVWSQQARLSANDGAANDRFGIGVAVVGDMALIGASSDTTNVSEEGSVYFFTRTGTIWSQQAKLLASDRTAKDQFGFYIAVDGNTALISAAADDEIDLFAGSAYIFTYDGTGWNEQAKLLASDGGAGDEFAHVALSGNTAVVGAQFHANDGVRSGAAYIFKLATPPVFLPLVITAAP